MKTLLFDLETAPALGYFWDGRLYENDILEVKEDSYIMCFAYQWAHLKEIHWIGQPDFGAFKKDARDDTGVVKALWKLFDEADVLIAHNGKQFDIRKANARFLLLKLPPPAPSQVLDTKQIAKKYFALPSNKLDEISRQLDDQRKLPHTGKQLWFDCMRRDPKAWKTMEAYNKHDVVLLKGAYDRFLPWIDNHPNRNIYEPDFQGCPNCGSSQVQERGSGYTKTAEHRRFCCKKCGKWFRGKTTRSIEYR